MSERWADWDAIEAAQRAADNPRPVVIPFPRQPAQDGPQAPVGAAKLPPVTDVTPEPPVKRARRQIDDARGMRLLARWTRQLFLDE